jgi:NADH-quinone oxidoreductase subunit J
MLTRAPTGRQDDLTVRRALPAAVVAVLVAVLLGVTVVAGFSDVRIDLDRAVVGSAETTGSSVFRYWVLPFEVLSVLLLAALVGAIVLSRLRADLSAPDAAMTAQDADNSAARGGR